MSYRSSLALTLTVLCAVGASATPLLARGGGVRTYAVTVTNVTRGQVLSPPVAIAHDHRFSLFTPGEPASPELVALAEDADNDPLLALPDTEPSVFDVQAGPGPIPPGESVTVEVNVRGHFRHITVAGMLVTTNDAFYAASTFVRGSDGGQWLQAVAYDAGSEENTESCEHIPGPPCEHRFVRVPDSAEGFVHVHAGIHGGVDLMPAMHDWRNPTTFITIQRVR